MRPWGAIHIASLLVTALLAAAIAILCRRRALPGRTVRVVLALILAVNELYRYYYVGLRFPDELPLHLCSVSTWMAVAACLTGWSWALEFAYFEGIAGAGLALLNPDLPPAVMNHWPSYGAIRYLIEHGGLIVAAVALVGGRLLPLRPGAVRRAMAMLVVFYCALIAFNLRFHTNYSYTLRKPVNPSPLDYMGPWPVYLFVCVLVAGGLFWLLWLPARSYSPRSTARGLRLSSGQVGSHAAAAVNTAVKTAP
jgi:hypothetical integral membrane protein (TIGR02206 family)